MGQRERLLAAVMSGVERAGDRRDLSHALDPAALTAARDLAAFAAEGDLEAAHALAWLHYLRSQALPRARAEREWKEAVRLFGQCFVVAEETVPESLRPAVAERAVPDLMDLLTRSFTTTDPALLDTTVDLARRIERRLPEGHPRHAHTLSLLCAALDTRFARGGDLTDADEAVRAGRAAVRATPDGRPQRAGYLSNLCAALLNRSKRTGDVRDMDEAVAAGRAAARGGGEDDSERARYLTNLGAALRARFQRAGEPGDIDEAVEASRAAASAARADDPRRGLFLTNLAVALQSRFQRTGTLTDVHEAVEASRAAVRTGPRSAGFLSNLCLVLLDRFNRTGMLADVDEAVEAGRAAVRAAPDGHPDQAVSLTGLSSALRFRFQGTGMLADVDEAVEAGRAAVRATPDRHPERAARLAGLGACLRMRFERTGDPGDVHEAVEAGRAVLRIVPDGHPQRAAYLAEFAVASQLRFERGGALGDLDEAVEASRAAGRLTPDGHPRTMHLVSLCIALRTRFERGGDPRDLDEAVEAGRAARRVMPADHPQRAGALMNLASALRLRFERTGAAADSAEERSVWEGAAESAAAPPWIRLRAARGAARLAASSDPGRAAAFLERAVLTLPQVAPRRLRRGDQQHALGTDAVDLAADAAALALTAPGGTASQRAARALRLVEAGRAVLLSQALDTRDDLSELHVRHPELASRFVVLRDLLDREQTAAEEAAAGAGHERHRLAAELEELMDRIRTLEGFTGFGLPPTLDALLSEAAHGPVVTYNISRYRSDALLLTGEGITSCPLPLLTEKALYTQLETFHQALGEVTAPDGDRIAAQRSLRGVLEWLWEAAAEPVLSALAATSDMAARARPGELPRVWWAPGGLLGLLPLHAAGFHTDQGDAARRRTVLDRVISSYTPTVRALRHARRSRLLPSPADEPRSLIIAMPNTPGLSPLAHAAEEARRIHPLLPRPVHLTAPGPTADGAPPPPSRGTPTTDTVLACLPQYAVAHFACHAESDHTDPAQSRLLLNDHATTPLTVAALARMDLTHAQLAYLSACSTADPGSFDLLDEAIHLTSAFQLAGFPHVIGTLWPVSDRLAADIAESFYTHLTNTHLTPDPPGGTLTPARSATALHHTIRAIRDRYPATPSLWAGHLHAGA
ncbi:CHAT domain-containing protein [Streptomyces sp. KN37]|uniref:CHAT domain-containing protein n=1 Tax=Streptomyces sp. KN37 TaxID=3090667 RepID=UPI002A75CBB9|nr:CHAT domain-containing protein [Streptomyces sp. KN37]WPO70082.1 CHAT domain-containing protein [Streptomyces sp. KN37]